MWIRNEYYTQFQLLTLSLALQCNARTEWPLVYLSKVVKPMDKIENSSTNTYLSKMQLLFPYHRMTKQTDRGEIEGSFTQNLAATRWYIYITDRQLLFAAINMVSK
jgi:hypothetical protein